METRLYNENRLQGALDYHASAESGMPCPSYAVGVYFHAELTRLLSQVTPIKMNLVRHYEVPPFRAGTHFSHWLMGRAPVSL